MKKEYTSISINRPARPRSKRLREMGSGGGSYSTSMTIIGGGGGGGSAVEGHTHENKQDLDRLSTDENGYVWVKRQISYVDETTGEIKYKEVNEKVKAGIADVAATLLPEEAEKFLSSVKNDTAHGHITFENGTTAQKLSVNVEGAQFGQEFVGGITGVGGKIDGAGNGELESLRLRRFLEVPEMRYNRTEIIVGNDWTAPGGGIIESVTPDLDSKGMPLMSGLVKLHLEDGEIGTVAVDDICQGIFHDAQEQAHNSSDDHDDGLGNFRFSGFFTCYFRITEVIGARKQFFRYSLRSVSDKWSHAYHPCTAMHFVGYGNFTNKERQSSRYSTRTYERYLKNVNDWEFTSEMIAAQFGDLSNLTIFGLQMAGYSAYLNNIYMSGVIEQFKNVPIRMEIDTEGDPSLAYGEHIHVTCMVFKAYEDLTSQVIRWEIVRDSGDPADDAAWALRPKVKAFKGVIDLHLDKDVNIDDLGKSDISTLFTVRAWLPSEKDPATINIIL